MLKRSRIELEQAIEAINVYESISLEMIDVSLKDAVRLAGRHKIYVYDAYILQCPIENNVPLISLDKELIAVAKSEGIQVIEVNV